MHHMYIYLHTFTHTHTHNMTPLPCPSCVALSWNLAGPAWFDFHPVPWVARNSMLVKRGSRCCNRKSSIPVAGEWSRGRLSSFCRETATEGLVAPWVILNATEIHCHGQASFEECTSIILQLWKLPLGGNQGICRASLLSGGSRGETCF